MFHEKTKLVLGRGEIYFDRFIGSARDGERYIGNTPMFRVEREIRRINRMSSYKGQKHARKGIVVEETLTGSLTTDHISADNLIAWHGSTALTDNSGDALVPYYETLVVRKDRYYQLGIPVNGVGLTFIDSAQVRMTNAVGAILSYGVHYFLERDSGRLNIPPSSPLEDGSAIFVQYFKRPSATTVLTPVSEDIFGALRYVATNDVGPKVDYWFPQVRISPRGAIDLKGDEFRQMNFDIEAIRLSPNTPLVYVIVDKSPPLPITADTALLRADTIRYRADMGAWE